MDIVEITSLLSNLSVFIQVWGYSMIFFGSIGHLFSICVLTRSSLRSNPCSRYFLASTMTRLLTMIVNVPVRILQLSYNINIPVYSNAACKIVIFLLFFLRGQTPWFIFLASVDRSSSIALRAWSTRHVADRAILFATLIGLINYIHVLVTYNLIPQVRVCYVIPGIFETISGIWFLLTFSIGPSILMLIFGILTIKNIRQSVRRVMPVSNQTLTQNETKRKSTDRYLIQMLLGQCITYVITTLPFTIINIYTTINTTATSDVLQRTRSTVMLNVSAFIAFIVPSTSFYSFVFSSRGFRYELLKILKQQFGRQQQRLVNTN